MIPPTGFPVPIVKYLVRQPMAAELEALAAHAPARLALIRRLSLFRSTAQIADSYVVPIYHEGLSADVYHIVDPLGTTVHVWAHGRYLGFLGYLGEATSAQARCRGGDVRVLCSPGALRGYPTQAFTVLQQTVEAASLREGLFILLNPPRAFRRRAKLTDTRGFLHAWGLNKAIQHFTAGHQLERSAEMARVGPIQEDMRYEVERDRLWTAVTVTDERVTAVSQGNILQLTRRAWSARTGCIHIPAGSERPRHRCYVAAVAGTAEAEVVPLRPVMLIQDESHTFPPCAAPPFRNLPLEIIASRIAATYHGWCAAFEESGAGDGSAAQGFLRGSEAWRTRRERARWVEAHSEAAVAHAEAQPLRR